MMSRERIERRYIDQLKDEEQRAAADVRDRGDAGRRAAEERRGLAELEGTTTLLVACRVSGARVFYFCDGMPTCPTCAALDMGFRRTGGGATSAPVPVAAAVPNELDDLYCDACGEQLGEPVQHEPSAPHAPWVAYVLVTESGAVVDECAHVLYDPAD